MNRKSIIKACLVLICIVSIISCETKKQGPSQKAKNLLSEKLERFTDKIEKRCLDKIRFQAEKDVDSFLLSTAKRRKVKNIEQPNLNDRPERPEVEFPEYQDPHE